MLDHIDGPSTGDLICWGALVSAVVIGVRMIWQFTIVYVIRAIDRREVQRARRASWRVRAIIGWAGMRGSVSLAAALALPTFTDAGERFPHRDLIIYLAFAVILVTILGQGLTLGPLIRRLHVRDDGSEEREEVAARVRVAEAGMARVDELVSEEWVREFVAFDDRQSAENGFDLRRQVSEDAFDSFAPGVGQAHDVVDVLAGFHRGICVRVQ